MRSPFGRLRIVNCLFQALATQSHRCATAQTSCQCGRKNQLTLRFSKDELALARALRLQRLAPQIVQEWCEEIFFAIHKVYPKTNDEGFNRNQNKVSAPANESYLRPRDRPSWKRTDCENCQRISCSCWKDPTDASFRHGDLFMFLC